MLVCEYDDGCIIVKNDATQEVLRLPVSEHDDERVIEAHGIVTSKGEWRRVIVPLLVLKQCNAFHEMLAHRCRKAA